MVNLTEQNFAFEVLQSSLPVLVDFFASWCGPCQVAGPVLEKLAKECKGKIKFGKVDVDQNQAIAQKFGVMSIPTVILFREGKEVGRKVGFEGKEGYGRLIDSIFNG